MHATIRVVSLLVVPLLPALAAAEEKGRLADALALQDVIQKAIERAEPSVACILVSRSSAYRDWGAAPTTDGSGKLGSFDARRARSGVRLDDDKRQREIRNLDLSDPDTVPESYGSGVVIDESGLILTNAHVVRNATKIYVRLPGNRGSWADIHASDPRSDLAVLRLLDTVPGLKPLPMGDGGTVRKGQFILSLANPYAAGFRDGSPSASWGIVSNLRRRAPGRTTGLLTEAERGRITLHHYGTLIQTDTRISLGCSGGALLNLKGELIGLTTAIAALSGSETPGGYAVPLTAPLRRIIDVLKRGEEVEYGFLGVVLYPEVRPGQGVRISDVAAGTPADKAHLLRGDYILSINDQPVRENEDLFLLVGIHLAGTKIVIETARSPGTARVKHEVTLAKFYVPAKSIAANRPAPRRGLRVDWTSLRAQRIDFGPWGRAVPEGVLVREVVPRSPADKAQLQADRVITHVNGQAVRTPADFYREMDRAAGPVVLTVRSPDGLSERLTLEDK